MTNHHNISALPKSAAESNQAFNLAKKGRKTDISDDAVNRILYTTFAGKIDTTDYKYQITSFVPNREKNYYQQLGFPVGEWLIPDDMLFVMGDNRDLSLDSRIYGFIPLGNVSGIKL